MSEKCTNLHPGRTSHKRLDGAERPVSGGGVGKPSFVVGSELPPTPVVSPLVRAFHTYFVPGESKEGQDAV